ncbi:fimbrial protein [Pseudomonas sp. FP818]|uniref:fimbrial protein n=1 Tax=Pseudomonas sp. FP818 TaxID=2954099 RepID=UPI00273251BD|nr:fimbrial protein [Pseudomonas sp. FP818]WLI32614.1 fimbrial protein [Pseudomonas sp. FP818]
MRPPPQGLACRCRTATATRSSLEPTKAAASPCAPTRGSYTIPLRARYLQTASKVTPGPANASATFTIIYQ